jgi:hypothetical protein
MKDAKILWEMFKGWIVAMAVIMLALYFMEWVANYFNLIP